MTRRRPPPRIDEPRSSDNEKRDLSLDLPNQIERDNLAAAAWYRGYGKHKRNPYLWKLPAFHGEAADRTFCEDADFTINDKLRIPGLLRRGIEAGLFGDLERGGYPSMLWTIAEDGWIFELRLTNEGQAEYHGYPLRPSNAFGRKVIARYEEWLQSLPRVARRQRPELHDALQAAQERYK